MIKLLGGVAKIVTRQEETPDRGDHPGLGGLFGKATYVHTTLPGYPIGAMRR
jgi:hypothetical protein